MDWTCKESGVGNRKAESRRLLRLDKVELKRLQERLSESGFTGLKD